MKKIATILLFGIFCSSNSFGQKLNEVDDSLAQMFVYMDTIEFSDTAISAKARLINDHIEAYLVNVLKNVTATFDADFAKSKKEGLNICTSPDHNVRVYSWDSNENGEGTLKMTRKVYQYKHNNSVHVSTDNMISGFGLCYKIVTVNTVDKKKVYLETDSHTDPPYDDEELMAAFIIDKGSLRNYNFFERKGHFLSELSYSFNPMTEEQEFNMHFSKDKKTLFVPRTDEYGIFHGYTTYTFDGKIFRAKVKSTTTKMKI